MSYPKDLLVYINLIQNSKEVVSMLVWDKKELQQGYYLTQKKKEETYPIDGILLDSVKVLQPYFGKEDINQVSANSYSSSTSKITESFAKKLMLANLGDSVTIRFSKGFDTYDQILNCGDVILIKGEALTWKYEFIVKRNTMRTILFFRNI